MMYCGLVGAVYCRQNIVQKLTKRVYFLDSLEYSPHPRTRVYSHRMYHLGLGRAVISPRAAPWGRRKRSCVKQDSATRSLESDSPKYCQAKPPRSCAPSNGDAWDFVAMNFREEGPHKKFTCVCVRSS